MASTLIIHHWLIDHASGSLIHQTTGEQRRLGEYQLKLLQVLADHAGQTLTREELTNLVWERRVIGNNSLPNAIHALRLALEDDGKQQRIIKTVPKKGYILEAEFCQFGTSAESAEKTEGELSDVESLTDIPPITTPSSAVDTAETHLPVSKKRAFWFWLVPLQSLLLLGLLLILAKNFFTTASLQPQEKHSAAYSNIRVVEIHRRWGVTPNTEDLNKQLGPVLFALNQQLKNRQMNMDIFLQTSGVSLQYTIMLSNACDHQQLAMNILNWRTDGRQLSALVYRESERKINEMANCVTKSAGNNVASATDSRGHEPAVH